MDPVALIRRLEGNADVFRALLSATPHDEAVRTPEGGGWSIRDVACHLLDEERLDFRARLELTLRGTDEPWPPIDPEGWVEAHDYASQELREVLAAFLEERTASVAWLRGLGDVDWEETHAHPTLGSLRAGDLLLSWVTHDALHLRQLAHRTLDNAAASARPYSGDYAGPW
jgi:uncharacterized damage-inducible protein DinB